LGYCIYIDPITRNTHVTQLIKKRQDLEPDDDLELAYGFWDAKEGILEELEDGAKIRNCALDMIDGCECVCGCHDYSF